MKVKIFIIALLFFSNLLEISLANEGLDIIQPSLSYSEAITNSEKNLISEGFILDKYLLVDIEFNYMNGKWIIYYQDKSGSLGGRFHIYIDDRNPSIYKIARGA